MSVIRTKSLRWAGTGKKDHICLTRIVAGPVDFCAQYKLDASEMGADLEAREGQASDTVEDRKKSPLGRKQRGALQ